MKIISREISDVRESGQRRTLRIFDVVGCGPHGVVEISPSWAWSVSLVYGDSLLVSAATTRAIVGIINKTLEG